MAVANMSARPMPNTSSSTKPVRLSRGLSVFLSIITIVIGSFALFDMNPVFGVDPPIFTTTRHPKTGEHFLNLRLQNTSKLLYPILHVMPAIIWSVLMPLQHLDSVRNRWPAVHRASGYAVLGISLLLAISGFGLLGNYKDSMHHDILHLHSLGGRSPISWPTFRLGTGLLEFPYLVTLYKAGATARAKRFVEHRQWATAHTIFAYAIAVFRVALVSFYSAGWIAVLYAKVDLGKLLSIPDTREAMAEAEADIFALGIWVAALLLPVWFAYEWGYLSPSRIIKSRKVD